MLAASCAVEATSGDVADIDASPSTPTPVPTVDPNAPTPAPTTTPTPPPTRTPATGGEVGLDPSRSVLDIDGTQDWCEAPAGTPRPGLTDPAAAALDASVAVSAEYQIAADIDPRTGLITGRMRVVLPPTTSSGPSYFFRVVPDFDEFLSGFSVGRAAVNGVEVTPAHEQGLLVVPANSDAERPVVELDFDYTIGGFASGDDGFSLFPESRPGVIGMLRRTSSGIQLGHWYPQWLDHDIAERSVPTRSDLARTLPVSSMCATIGVPDGFEILGSGVSEAGSKVVAGAGLRDLSLFISRNIAETSAEVGGITVRVWHPLDEPAAGIEVLDHTIASLEALEAAFGPYPYTEIDVASTALGSGIGGVAWPGIIWIERSLFSGGLSRGGFGDLFRDPELGPLAVELAGPATSHQLEWVIAHELGHEWWSVLTGNDTTATSLVEEPLAQLSACVAMQRIHPAEWRTICDAMTVHGFVAFGADDAPVLQRLDRFDSPAQYSTVVYGKAPGFWYAAGDLIGWPALTAALRDFLVIHRFDLFSTDELRGHLIARAGGQGEQMAWLWERWLRGTHGYEDIDVTTWRGVDLPRLLELDEALRRAGTLEEVRQLDGFGAVDTPEEWELMEDFVDELIDRADES